MGGGVGGRDSGGRRGRRNLQKNEYTGSYQKYVDFCESIFIIYAEVHYKQTEALKTERSGFFLAWEDYASRKRTSQYCWES